MSDKIIHTETGTSGGSGASDLYNKVMSHEGRVWNNVITLNASPGEYLEAAAQVVAATAVGKFVGYYSDALGPSGIRGAADSLVSPRSAAAADTPATASANNVTETFGRLSLFEKPSGLAASEAAISETSAAQSGNKVIDMAAYKNQFAGKTQVEVSSTPGSGSKADALFASSEALKSRRGGATLPPSVGDLGKVVPRDYIGGTSSAAPSLDNLKGELKF